MNYKKILILMVLVFIGIMQINIVNAGENSYGTYNAWIKLEDGDWKDAPVTGESLDVYEPFYVKANISTKIKCYPSCSIQGVGSTVTFEVIEGPSEFDKSLSFDGEKEAGWSETVIWKIRPTNNSYVGGQTPLKLHLTFAKKSQPRGSGLLDFDYKMDEINLINPHINNEIWEGYQEEQDSEFDDNQQDNLEKTPGFELVVFILAAITIISYYDKKKNN